MAKKQITKWSILLLIILLTLTNGCVKEAETPIKMGLAVLPLEENSGENLAQVILTIQSETDMQNVTGQINLKQGLELTRGNLQWQTDLQAGQPQTINITIKTPEKGEFEVKATTLGISTSTIVSAEPEKRVGSSEIIYPSLEEWKAREEEKSKNPNTYQVCDTECWVPEPLKGKNLNKYFRSLDLQEDPVYVTIRFESPDLEVPPEQLAEYIREQEAERDEILKKNGVVLVGGGYDGLYGWHEAKAPQKFLEGKHYDFIRWIGIKSPKRKLQTRLREEVWDKNCTGKIKLIIITYEKLTEEQYEKIKQTSNGELFGYYSTHINEFNPTDTNSIELEIDVTKLKDTASLGFVQEIELSGFGSVSCNKCAKEIVGIKNPLISEEELRYCERDSDCMKKQGGCCKCDAGGNNKAINKKYGSLWDKAIKDTCTNKTCSCIDYMSHIVSCMLNEKCINNQCELAGELYGYLVIKSAQKEPIFIEEVHSCKEDADCIPVRADCLGCPRGGNATTINKDYLLYWENSFGLCGRPLIETSTPPPSQHWTCIVAIPKCINEKCKLVKNE